MATSENSSKKGLIFLKKAISLLLLVTTLLSCCALFFACDDDDDTIPGVQAIDNKNAVVIDIASAGLAAGTSRDTVTTAKWDLKAGNQFASSRILNLSLTKKGLADYKEITFWMYNDSTEDVTFNLFFVMDDGTEIRAQTDLDNPYVERLISTGFGNKVEMKTVNFLIAHPGWHKYTVALDEVEPLSGQSRIDYTYDKKSGKSTVKFDKSAITGIKLDASNANFYNNLSLHIGSIEANSNKYGTMKGFGVEKIANAVCFYKESNFYLYNQLRYCLIDDEAAELGIANDSVYVPIAVLAEHRGAQITVNTKENVTFIYNGTTHEFKAGDTFTYISNERSYNSGRTMQGTTSSIGNYLTVPMEVAANTLGYQLFYDTTGLAIFSDRPNPDANTDWEDDWENVTYVDPMDANYYEDPDDGVPGRQLGYITQIVKLICFDYYTGSDLLEDMDKIYGENTHGNLVLTNAQIEKLKEYVKPDSVYRSWFESFEAKYAVGSSKYTAKGPYFHLPDNQRLDNKPAEDIIPYSFLYRMTGNDDYAARAIKLMEALSKFKDPVTEAKSWHPEHFLDAGDTMYYFAIGYDWCYDYIADDETLLKKLENTAWECAYGAAMGFGELFDFWKDPNNIQKKNSEADNDGDPNTIRPAWQYANFPYRVYSLESQYKISDLHISRYEKTSYDICSFNGNWNAVCNNGMISIAFAFANVNAQFRAASEYILTRAVNDTTYAMVDCYSPDGGHPEGPSYWYFGTKYQVPMIMTIKNCTGSYHGLNDFSGFEDSYDYTMGVSSNHNAWNYHDSGPGQKIPSEQYFVSAYMFNDPNLSQFRYNQILSGSVDIDTWDIFYYDPTICYENSNLDLSLDYISYKIGIVTFKSDLTDSQLFCGLHGGANNVGHGQLDIGNFILEYNGTRFFCDLGLDNYDMWSYFTFPNRHWLYLNRAEGQNTLVINPSFVHQVAKVNDEMQWGSGGQYVDVWHCDFYQRTNAVDLNNGKGMKYDQAFSAISNILGYGTSTDSAYAVVDMGSAYGYYDVNKTNENGALNMTSPTGKRGLLVTDNRSTVIIQDEMDLTAFGRETNTVYWNGHVVNGGVITISDDGQTALISYNGHSLLCEIVVPEGYANTWKFESRSADYLRETGLFMQPGEYSRDGKQKLVATATVGNDVKIAVVCRLLSSGPYNYTWTDIDNWDSFLK